MTSGHDPQQTHGTTRQPLATVSVDLDDTWAYLRSFGRSDWRQADTILPQAIERAVSVFDRFSTRATFFVVGRDLELPAVAAALKVAAQEGHEIANHSYGHDLRLHEASSGVIGADLDRSTAVIEAVTGRRPVGFRGPGYGLSVPLIEALRASGYLYDASFFASSVAALTRLYHRSKASATPPGESDALPDAAGALALPWAVRLGQRAFRWRWPDGGHLAEVPVSCMPGAGLPFHMTYLAWLAERSASLSNVYLRAALAACAMAGLRPSFLFHAADFLGAEQTPELQFFPGMRLPARAKSTLVDGVLARLRAGYELAGLGIWVDAHQAELAERPAPVRRPRESTSE